MNITLEADKFALIAVARQSFVAQQQENSARTGDPLAAAPTNEQLINNSPPLSQQLQAIDAREIQLAATASSSVANGNANSTDNAKNPDAAHNVAVNAPNSNDNNANANTGSNNSNVAHDAFGRFNIVA